MRKKLLLPLAMFAMLTLPLAAASASPQDSPKPLSVNELAAKPEEFLGKVAVTGRVAATTPGKGFILIDSAKCANCTTECLSDKTGKKIPTAWSGAAPKVTSVVRVDGTLAKTAKGYTLTAQKVTSQ